MKIFPNPNSGGSGKAIVIGEFSLDAVHCLDNKINISDTGSVLVFK
jgi:hypothetical protein